MSRIIEMGSRVQKGGRRYIKLALLTVHDDKETNLNGIHWKEEYILNNLETAKDMPICCEFIDDEKSTPLDHGYTGQMIDENGIPQPLFQNSEAVGHITNAWIDNIEIEGEEKRVLIGEGYLYNQRYPNFVKWLKTNISEGSVKSSIEIVGKAENNGVILYEDGATSELRTPISFDFSSTAILSVKEADENAVVLEAASFNKTKESEDELMDEQTLNMICDSVKNTISEVNAKNAEYEAQIAELNATIAERDNTISELNASVEEVKTALEAVKAEMKEAEDKLDGAWEEKRALEKLLGEAKAKERLGELESAMSAFTEQEKCYAEKEIESFKENPVESEINSVIDAIYRGIGKNAKNQPVVAEANSADIYGEIFRQETKTVESADGSIY